MNLTRPIAWLTLLTLTVPPPAYALRAGLEGTTQQEVSTALHPTASIQAGAEEVGEIPAGEIPEGEVEKVVRALLRIRARKAPELGRFAPPERVGIDPGDYRRTVSYSFYGTLLDGTDKRWRRLDQLFSGSIMPPQWQVPPQFAAFLWRSTWPLALQTSAVTRDNRPWRAELAYIIRQYPAIAAAFLAAAKTRAGLAAHHGNVVVLELNQLAVRSPYFSYLRAFLKNDGTFHGPHGAMVIMKTDDVDLEHAPTPVIRLTKDDITPPDLQAGSPAQAGAEEGTQAFDFNAWERATGRAIETVLGSKPAGANGVLFVPLTKPATLEQRFLWLLPETSLFQQANQWARQVPMIADEASYRWKIHRRLFTAQEQGMRHAVIWALADTELELGEHHAPVVRFASPNEIVTPEGVTGVGLTSQLLLSETPAFRDRTIYWVPRSAKLLTLTINGREAKGYLFYSA